VKVRAILLDVEGTLVERGRLVAGAVEAVTRLRAGGLTVRFLTNTDAQPPVAVADRLRRLGFDVDDGDVFTPVSAARAHLGRDARLHLLVSAAVRPALADLATDGASATHVVVGDCRDVLDYARLDAAFAALRDGARLVALQRGRYFQAADGDHLDTGAVVAALEFAAGTTAEVVGKPAAEFFARAAESAGVAPDRCLVVGDDATTDVAGGREVGALTVGVRTGKYADQRRGCALPAPDVLLDSVAELPGLLFATPAATT
jgi:HAD superfamily hydrolase (TIGR01458 family)